MAEEAVKMLEQYLSCPICQQVFTDPKQLQCQHVFCKKCLEGKVTQDKLNVICSTCSQATPTFTGNTRDLHDAPYVKCLLNLQEIFKKIVCHPVGTCSEHVGKSLELYCKDKKCKTLICERCALKGGKHFGHNYTIVTQETFEKCTGKFSKSMGSLETQRQSLAKALEDIDARSGELAYQHQATKTMVQSTMRQLHDILYDREATLLSLLNRISLGKETDLQKQRSKIECTQAQLCSFLVVLKEALGANREADIVKEKETIKNQLSDLVKAFQPQELQVKVKADTEFTFSCMNTACSKFGLVSAPSVPDPTQSHLVPKSQEVGEISSVCVQINDYQGKPFTSPVHSIEAELVCSSSGNQSRGRVEYKGQGQYRISYLVTTEGPHLLHVKVGGQPITGSPFSQQAKMSHDLSSSFAGHVATCFSP